MKARNTKAHLRMVGVVSFAGVVMATRATGACAQDQAPASGAQPATVHFISAGNLPPNHPGGMDITYASQHPPKYPLEAIRARHEGKVLVMAKIGVNGQVTETKIELSSGYLELDDSAVSTVSGWKFNPAYRDGAPVASWARVPVNFSLPKGRCPALSFGGLVGSPLPTQNGR